MPKKLTQDDFINKARIIHGDKYDYSKVNYMGSENKVCIVCPKHGEFWQTPHRHLMGDKCPKCGSKAKLNNEEFIKRAIKVHGTKYNYSKVNYVNNETPVCIICPEHGEFWQRPSSHLLGNGCPKCGSVSTGSKRRLLQNEFVKKAVEIHGEKYDYGKVKYITSITPVVITCPLHGDFLQTPHKHLSGHGCPVCGNKNNLTEVRLYNSLKNIFCNVEYQKIFPFLCDKRCIQKLDFYLPEYNVGIELNGRQHYVPVEKFGGEKWFQRTRELDIIKYSKCLNNGIKIFYYTPPQMKNYITNYFEKVYTSFDELINDIKNYKND